MAVRATLPDLNTLDAGALRTLIFSQHEEILHQHEQLASKEEALVRKDEQLASHQAEIERLKLLIAKLRRIQFGRKSEKIEQAIEQLELQLEDLEAREAKPEEGPTTTLSSKTSSQAHPARHPLPDHLPREVHRHEPAEKNCPDCDGRLRKLGEEISEVLEYVPAQWKVLRHVRLKLSCARCERVIEAPAPSRPIE